MKIRIGILLPLLLLLGGCYDYTETDDMAIVSGLHAAKGEAEAYKLTFEIVGTKPDGQGPRTKVTSKEGATVAEAIDNATAVSGKKLYFDHAQVLAIDHELAREGIGDILDYFSRQNDMRLNMNIVISKGMTGDDLFKSEEGDVRSFVIADMLKANEERAITPNVELYSFITDSFNRGEDGFLPVVNMEEDGNISLESTAVFKDAQMMGELGKDGTKYLMLLKNIGERGGFIMEKEGDAPVSFEIRSRKADIKPRIEGGRLITDVEFSAQFGVLELTGDASVLRPEKLSEMEDELGKYVFEELTAFLDELSGNSSADLLGIERRLTERKEMPGENFPQLYKEAQFNVETDVSIIDSGRTLRKLEEQG